MSFDSARLLGWLNPRLCCFIAITIENRKLRVMMPCRIPTFLPPAVYCPTQPSIETSTNCIFSCWRGAYPGLTEHLKAADLDPEVNTWRQVWLLVGPMPPCQLTPARHQLPNHTCTKGNLGMAACQCIATVHYHCHYSNSTAIVFGDGPGSDLRFQQR